MRKKTLIIISLVIVIAIIFILIKNKQNRAEYKDINNKVNNIGTEFVNENNLQKISPDTMIENNNYSGNNINNVTADNIIMKKNEKDNNKESLPDNTIVKKEKINKNSLPDDTGLTFKGVSKTYNQDIMSQANIAYLLGYTDFDNTNNLKKYIEKHTPKSGIFISKVTGYDKTDNPYDFVMDRSELMKKMLSNINMKYNINKQNYLEINKNEISELDKKINKIISSDKKIIIAFVPAYYIYINDTEMGLVLSEMQEPYISLKPYNNIYTYICNPDQARDEDFLNMIEEISQILD